MKAGAIKDESDWPAHSEELSRKALTVLEGAIHNHLVEGTLTERELRLVVDTLVDTVQGLVPHDVTDTIYAVRKDLELSK
jgi:hypothetical protein